MKLRQYCKGTMLTFSRDTIWEDRLNTKIKTGDADYSIPFSI